VIPALRILQLWNRTLMHIKAMTSDEIQAEFGWSGEMICTLLQTPDSPRARRNKATGEYSYGLYRRERVLEVAQTPEAVLAKNRWDATVHGVEPAPGWTTRLRDIGDPLGINAVAVGRILNLMGFRSNKQVSDHAVAVGCGGRRWDGFCFHVDWPFFPLFKRTELVPNFRMPNLSCQRLQKGATTLQVPGKD
jgi:hypothetical protein